MEPAVMGIELLEEDEGVGEEETVGNEEPEAVENGAEATAGV